MTTNPAFDLPGPGLTRQAYLDLLAAGHETGWYDQNGDPAPWPEDFLDPDSGWKIARGGDDPRQPRKRHDLSPQLKDQRYTTFQDLTPGGGRSRLRQAGPSTVPAPCAKPAVG